MPDSPTCDDLGNKQGCSKSFAKPPEETKREQQKTANTLKAVDKLPGQEKAAKMETLLGCRIAAPQLPVDVLTKTLAEAITCYTNIHDVWDGRGPWNSDEYLEERRLLYRAALVSRNWNIAACRILYRGYIHIYETESLHMFVRTLQNNAELSSSIQALRIVQPWNNLNFHKYILPIYPLVANLRKLETLGFVFPEGVQIPLFAGLEDLIIRNEVLHRIAPLLQRTPNLRSLTLIHFLPKDKFEARGVRKGFLPVGLGPEMENMSPPSYRLQRLSLMECELSAAQWEWLIPLPHDLDYVQLRETDQSCAGLARHIGPHVQHLHLESMMAVWRYGSAGIATTISSYTALKVFQIDICTWPWESLLQDLAPTLQTLNISYCKQACFALQRALSDRSWQEKLRRVVVRHQPAYNHYAFVNAADVTLHRNMLEQACDARVIQLTWVTEEASE